MAKTYLTTEELAQRIKYEARYIRETLKDAYLIEGIHYIRPFGGRMVLYIWEAVEEFMGERSANTTPVIPLSRGRVCNG